MRRTSVAFLALGLAFSHSLRSQSVHLEDIQNNPGETIVSALALRGEISDQEKDAIDTAIKLNPSILDAATRQAGLDASDPRALIYAPEVDARSARNDLLNRARIQAIASGVVTVQPDLRSRIEPLLTRTGDPKLPLVRMPASLEKEALEALGNRVLIIRPLCPIGALKGRQSDGCLRGDPWSLDLFRAVLPIYVDQKLTCTGSYLGGGVILTAAHCVLNVDEGGDVVVADKSDVFVLDSKGKQLHLISQPQVPGEMMGNCMPVCADMAFDFALLRVDDSGENWQPIPVLTEIASTGDVPITLAGYGITNVDPSLSKSGLFIGAQHLNLVTRDQALEWSYAFATTPDSTFCNGDSGGPIFVGSPRNGPDKLSLIGVISRFVSTSASCYDAKATAVNFTSEGPRAKLCQMIPNANGLCGH